MDHLYAPWRTQYTQNVHQTKKDNAAEFECVFCMQCTENEDEKNFILRRFNHTFVMLNLYPYNAGHILILPYQHQADLSELSKAARTELMEISTESCRILTTVLGAQGINLGLNLGKASGAGIPAHVHMHILPRWHGDTNFLPTLANTKAISVNLYDIYHQLKPAFEAIDLTLLS